MYKCPRCNSVQVSTERRIKGSSECQVCGFSDFTRNFINTGKPVKEKTMQTYPSENNFKYHKPTSKQQEKYISLQIGGRELAEMIDGLCPQSREKSLAFTKLEEAIMWANSSIARNE